MALRFGAISPLHNSARSFSNGGRALWPLPRAAVISLAYFMEYKNDEFSDKIFATAHPWPIMN
jgi:hypothetical protein